MSNPSDEFFKHIDYPSIIDTIKGVYTSDGTMSTLLDFERVLDEADLYAFQNWEIGELVSGPNVKRYTVDCIFMYPFKLMPNPKGAKRLLTVGCNVKFKKTTMKVPVKIESAEDYKPGTHYPKLIDREVWLIMIEMPKELMNDIREGSIELAGKDIDLEELDSAYDDDLDKQETDQESQDQDMNQGMDQGMDMGMDQGMGQMPPQGGGMM